MHIFRLIPQEEFVSNILLAYLSSSPEDRSSGRWWYPTANSIARGMAHEFGISVSQMAGIIAVLSPQISWERNCIVAYEFMRSPYERPTGITTDNWVKAKEIYEGRLGFIRGNKVRSFWSCILTGGDTNEVTIDTHSVDVALGEEAREKDKRYLVNKQIYGIFVDAYREAARQLRLPVTEVQATTWVWHRKGER